MNASAEEEGGSYLGSTRGLSQSFNLASKVGIWEAPFKPMVDTRKAIKSSRHQAYKNPKILFSYVQISDLASSNL